jgi:hypothetical protein
MKGISKKYGNDSQWHNCKMYSNEGELIGICSKGKLEWYVERGIAEQISENELKLKFEPKYRNNIQLAKMVLKTNRCVVCGCENNLKKCHVIPPAYKRLFPDEKKSHVSNDIVLLCNTHTYELEKLIMFYHNELKDDYNIKEKDFIDKPKHTLKKKCAFIISKLENKEEIPKKTMLELEEYIYYFDGKISEEKIKELSECSIIKKIEGTTNIYEYIIKKIIENNTLSTFIMNWKELFVQNMEPKYLEDDFYKDVIGYV